MTDYYQPVVPPEELRRLQALTRPTPRQPLQGDPIMTSPAARAQFLSDPHQSAATNPASTITQEIDRQTAARNFVRTQALPVPRALNATPLEQGASITRGRRMMRDALLRERPELATESEMPLSPAPAGQPRWMRPSGAVRVNPQLAVSAATGSGVQLPRESSALLDVISQFEGTADRPNRGYNTLVGGTQVADLSRHPNRVGVRTVDGPSTAFGRYQFTNDTWNLAARALGLPDMSPESQDRAAWWLAQRAYRGASGRELSADITQSNRWPAIANALGSEWASFPGSLGRNQRQFSLQDFQAALERTMGSIVQQHPRGADEYLGLTRGFRAAPRARNFEDFMRAQRRDEPISTRRHRQ